MEEIDRLKSNKIKEIHPHNRANFISRACFCWTFPVFLKGYKRDLTENDLYGPLNEHEAKYLGDRLENAWNEEIKSKRKPSLWRVLAKLHLYSIFLYGFITFVQELIVKMAQPLLMGRLMQYYTPNQTTVSKEEAYYYATAMVGMQLVNSFIQHTFFVGLQHLGMKVRVACCSLLYRKALKLSKNAMIKNTVGQMVNLMSNDVNRFDFVLIHFFHLLVAPFETTVVIYLLYTTVDSAAMAGIAVLLAIIPLQVYLGRRTAYYRRQTALKTDQRVKLMNEIISGMQVIKMYTWEKPFSKLVELARKVEIHQIKATSYLRAILFSFSIFTNRIAIFLCIIAYVFTGNNLTAEYVYVVSSYYGVLRQALTMFLPRGITTIAEANVSVKRLEEFLANDEIKAEEPENIQNCTKNNFGTNNSKTNGTGLDLVSSFKKAKKPIGISLRNVSAKWNDQSTDYSLCNIDFTAEQNQIIAIIGPIGSGKSTLFNVILKELEILEGTLEVSGSISYSPQEPWLFSSSIRQNILFGEKMDIDKYRYVIKVCALERDLMLLPHGDRTIVGEKGVMLSGGQKARVTLARAIYKDADIYLLDDPLSAVDAHVGKQLFDDCISTYLKDKCVVLVTHQLQYLSNVDRIYLLENGRVSISGNYEQIRSSSGEFAKLLQASKEPDENEKAVDASRNNQKESTKSVIDEKSEVQKEVKEQRSIGKLSKRIYAKYFQASGSYLYSIGIFALFVITQLTGSGADLYVTFWVNLEQDKFLEQLKLESHLNSDNSTEVNTTFASTFSEESWFTNDILVYIYSAIIVFLISITLIRSLSFFKVTMAASTKLHNRMFATIINSSMRFFNTNPSGRILNRFAKDMGSVDESLPQSILDTLQVTINAFSISMVLSSLSVWIILPTVIISILFYFYKTVFLSTSRNLKRIDGITRSPIYSHLAQSLQGLATIRAFKAENVLRNEFDNHQNLNISAYYLFMNCSRTFAFWLDVHSIIYIGFVILSFLFIGTESYGGNVGLAITQCTALTSMLQWGMRQWSELENQMTSVERVVEYTELPTERDEGKKIPPIDWPTSGNIIFDSVSMQYSTETPLVLKNLSFSINAGSKIGIVGRTGAGKSSLIAALFRLSEIEGDIIIDGVNTKDIPLNNLRSKLSIIPQEPVLFSGTLRKNLDPFDEFQDYIIWNALEAVKLKEFINDLPSNIHCMVSEGGANFSVGQRQLFCLARALIRSNKILILDEATANVDLQTDELIQETIRKTFADCTVLTIAHRLHTVMDSDKVLIMDSGRAVEFDHPYRLLQDTTSYFYKLIEQTGASTAETLMKIAEENFSKKKLQ